MKILIADEHALFRDNAALYISEINTESVVLQVSSLAQVLKILEKEQNIDLVIIDADMLSPHILQNIERLQNLSNAPRITIISGSEDIEQISKIIKTGIVGYIPRQTDLSLFREALPYIY